MRQLDAQRTAQRLPYRELVMELAAMMRARRDGRAHSPERLALPLQGGTLLCMPCTDGEFASVKLVSVHAANPSRGLASIQGEVILMRAGSGERLLLLDGPVVTARRTAAVSVLGALTLGADVEAPVLIVGAGAQARAHLCALHEVLGARRFLIASRTPSGARGLLESVRTPGVSIQVVEDATRALRDARLVITATTAEQPVFDDAVAPRALVIAIGAYRPQMCELPPALVRRAHVIVDDLPGARHEAGDLLRAEVDWQRVTALQDLVADDPFAAAPRRCGPGADDAPVILKTVGQALWDLAACRVALDG